MKFWISFSTCSETEKEHLGCIIVEATGPEEAVRACKEAGCTPSGNINALIMGPFPEGLIPENAPIGRLMATAECDALMSLLLGKA